MNKLQNLTSLIVSLNFTYTNNRMFEPQRALVKRADCMVALSFTCWLMATSIIAVRLVLLSAICQSLSKSSPTQWQTCRLCLSWQTTERPHFMRIAAHCSWRSSATAQTTARYIVYGSCSSLGWSIATLSIILLDHCSLNWHGAAAACGIGSHLTPAMAGRQQLMPGVTLRSPIVMDKLICSVKILQNWLHMH